MKISRGLVFYCILFLILIVGILIPKEKPVKETNLGVTTSRKEALNPEELVQNDPVLISSRLTIKPVSQRSSSARPANVIVTDKGDNLLVLINKSIRLPEEYEPSDLVSLADGLTINKLGLQLRLDSAKRLEEMGISAKKSGINLSVSSAYRSFWSQFATFSNKVSSKNLSEVEFNAARPGHSQHQLGTAVDFVLPDFKTMAWLEKNAYKYGFVLSYPEGKEAITGYQYEPWHYRYIGIENARKMIDSGLILEKFLLEFGVW